MDTCLLKTMASVVSLEKIETIRSQELMPSEVRLKFLKKNDYFVEFWCWGLIFGGRGGGGPGPPLDPPLA